MTGLFVVVGSAAVIVLTYNNYLLLYYCKVGGTVANASGYIMYP